MKIGFRIDIQKDLNDDEMKAAKKYADTFIIQTLQDPKKKYGGAQSYGGRDTPFSRGSCLNLNSDKLHFLRINRHKRIFGVIRSNNLDDNDGYGKLKIKKVDMIMYAQIGDIKG
jgi:hypothetical protein